MNIENIFKNNQSQFDNEELPEGMFNRFETKLDNRSKHKKRIRRALYISVAAASVAIIALFTFMLDFNVDNNVNSNVNIAENTVNQNTVETEPIPTTDNNINCNTTQTEVKKVTTATTNPQSEPVEMICDYDPQVKEVITYYQNNLDNMIAEIERDGCFDLEDSTFDTLRMLPLSPEELSFMPIDEQIAVVVNVYSAKIRVARQIDMLCENIDY